MELGLSLGDSSKDSKPFKFSTKNSNSEHHDTSITHKQDSLVFCMALGLNSTSGNQESLENYDQDDDQSHQTLQESDDHQGKLMGTPVQLDLLPLAPVPRHTGSLLRVSGRSENLKSENTSLRQLGLLQPVVACGSAEEEVLSANDVMETERTSSRASDEDENSHKIGKKLRLSKEQSAYLEENFKEHSTLNPQKQKLALAKQLNLRPRQVEVWFQNRRARTKLKQTEVDCEYLKRICDSLTEENRRLHKELQELRALNSSNPFCMQLPATTLTMCPSCERVAAASSATATTTTATTIPAANPPISKTSNMESTPKVFPFPLFRPRFYPFSPSHYHQSASS